MGSRGSIGTRRCSISFHRKESLAPCIPVVAGDTRGSGRKGRVAKDRTNTSMQIQRKARECRLGGRGEGNRCNRCSKHSRKAEIGGTAISDRSPARRPDNLLKLSLRESLLFYPRIWRHEFSRNGSGARVPRIGECLIFLTV